jgi:hypothetical protein
MAENGNAALVTNDETGQLAEHGDNVDQSEKITDHVDNLESESVEKPVETNAEVSASSDLRRSEREPKLSAKARENKEESFIKGFWHTHRRLQDCVKGVRKDTEEKCSQEALSQMIDRLEEQLQDLRQGYDQMRDFCTPHMMCDNR